MQTKNMLRIQYMRKKKKIIKEPREQSNFDIFIKIPKGGNNAFH